MGIRSLDNEITPRSLHLEILTTATTVSPGLRSVVRAGVGSRYQMPGAGAAQKAHLPSRIFIAPTL